MDFPFTQSVRQDQDSSNAPVSRAILPVFIKQIHDSPGEGVQLFGVTASMINLVALVRNIEHSSTKITYLLEDYSGQIEGHVWNDDDSTINIPPLLIHTYARVVGSVRNQGGKKTLMLFHVEPLDSLNHLTSHMLEVIHTRLQAEANGKCMDVDMPFVSTGIKSNNDGSLETLVMNFIRYGPSNGTHRDDIINKFKNQTAVIREGDTKTKRIALEDVDEVLTFLVSEGHVFNCGDDCFLYTDFN